MSIGFWSLTPGSEPEIKIPFHINFEELNLRFYVKFREQNAWKRGVVFIQEIVPKPALTFVANTLYKENYVTLPMEHSWKTGEDDLQVEYKWKKKGWNTFSAVAKNRAVEISADTEEEFITEHYWGYTSLSERKTSEYEVRHPRWQIYPVNAYKIEVNFCDVYGKDFEFLKNEIPRSVFLAEGSEIEVMSGKVI